MRTKITTCGVVLILTALAAGAGEPPERFPEASEEDRQRLAGFLEPELPR